MTTTTAYNIFKTGTIDSTRIPKYRFIDAVVDGGVLTLTSYSAMSLSSDGNAFEIAIDANSENNVRDCMLKIEVSESVTAPTITWPENFHPRTDSATDFACETGINVYWISEYKPDHFVVARWLETTGGSAA